MIQLTLYGRPITKKNSNQIRINKKTGKRYITSSKQYKKYEKDCLKQITGVHKKNIDSKINLKAIYYMPTKNKVDLNNLLNATCDILVNAHVIADDNSEIIASQDGCRVLYDRENPRVEITIDKFKE